MDYIKYKSGQELWASPKPCCMYLYIYYLSGDCGFILQI